MSALTTKSVVRRVTSESRQGAVLAVVLVGMIVATAILATLVRSAISAHRQLQLYEQELQAAWLVESGVERAVAQLSAAADYAGETWSVSAEQMGRREDAQVTIRVDPLAGQDQLRSILVQADIPDDPVRRLRRSKRVVVDLTRLGEK